MTRHITKTKKKALLQLSDELQDQFINFVHDKVGIVIKRGHKELLKLIAEYCETKDYSPYEYLTELQKADENSEIINRLVATITIGETYFFRDKRQIKILQEYVLPKIIQHKQERSEKTLRVWSAGCSSGEEIYTLIMLLNDLTANFKDWQCYFLATDINIDLLRKGMSGKYGEWSMRSIPESYLNKYFTKEGSHYQLDHNIIKLVNFDYLNLNSETYPSIMNGTSMQDLIICRNVLIYFDNNHIKQILTRLTKSITEDGYILLGASDPIALMETGIKSVQECPSLFSKRTSQPERQIYIPPTPVLPKVNKAEPVKLVKTPEKPQQKDYKSEIDTLIMEEKWNDAIFKIDQCAMMGELTSAILVAKAIALANLGKTIEAVKICEQAIAQDKMNKEAYFIYALSLSELNRYKDAENAFRKALYIDPGFLICRYQFGLFLIHNKRNQEGLKALQSTVKTASQFSDDEIVPDSNNMRYKELVSVLKNEIELYQ